MLVNKVEVISDRPLHEKRRPILASWAVKKRTGREAEGAGGDINNKEPNNLGMVEYRGSTGGHGPVFKRKANDAVDIKPGHKEQKFDGGQKRNGIGDRA